MKNTNTPKFSVGQPVIYINGPIYSLGIVKSIETDGKDSFNYYVQYHTGSTAACTHESDLKSISNEYAFLIVRKSVEEEIQENPIRQLAEKILKDSPFEELDYFKFEDYITNLLNGGHPEFPDLDICSNHLEYVLKSEIISYIEGNYKEIKIIEEEFINEIITDLLHKFDNDCLNLDLIHETINIKLIERRYIECNQNLF